MSDQPPPPSGQQPAASPAPTPPGPPLPGAQQPAQQAPAAQQPQGMIELHLQGNMMTAGMISPSVRINGYPVATGYGTTLVPVYAGRTRLDVNMQWMLTYGRAALDVDVAPGQTVPVWYAPPFHQFAAGSIGFDKQKRPGAAVFVGLMVVVVVLVVLIAVLNALG